jgi:hypothetical protein
MNPNPATIVEVQQTNVLRTNQFTTFVVKIRLNTGKWYGRLWSERGEKRDEPISFTKIITDFSAKPICWEEMPNGVAA